VAVLSVLICDSFGIHECLEYKSAASVVRSMAFADRYHDNKMLVEARLKITKSMVKRSAQLNQTLQDPAIRAEDLSARYESEILKQINEDKLNGALEQLFTFYEQIILCLE
jgi:tRNA isopentenyl-2-thiomethyl-A-37 hydroxylase MiaE